MGAFCLYTYGVRVTVRALTLTLTLTLTRWESVCLYTYGAPRVGNSQFAEYFETLFAGREA